MRSLPLRHIAPILLAIPLMQGCINNDIPFPRVQEDILSIAAEGELAPASINNSDLTVTITLDERTNPYKVKFTEVSYSNDATPSVDLLEGTWDLSHPISVTLKRWQSYQWIISANQTIERTFAIAGQIGDTEIDVPGRRIIVKVPENLNMSQLELLSCKLGPADITQYEPAMEPGKMDFSKPLHITVTYWDRSAEWTVYVEKTAQIVSTVSADAWSQVIWAVGNAPENADNGFEYRQGDGEWQRVPNEWITFDGGSFTARIIHLTPLTQYTVRAVSDTNIGNEITVETQATCDIINGSFDQWCLNGKIWCPWDEGGTPYWDTGNTGAATLGQCNVQPSDYTPTGSGKSVACETRFVGIAGIGKLAAGSIYTGSFVKVDGTNGIVDFGREFNLRPTKLKGYFQYKPVDIDYADNDHKYLIGRPDSCHIYVALTEWTAPYQIRTNPKNRQVFDPNAPEIIAYGELIMGSGFDGYREFEIVLDYRSTSRVPRYLLIAAAASKYGDYFTGGNGSMLYVDQFYWDWDY